MSLLKFFLFTFALTWTCFFTAVALAGGSLAVLVSPLVLLGTFAPSLVALALTTFENGRPGVEALLQRLFQWRVGLRWYVFALSYMAAVKLTVALADRMILGAWPGFGPPSPSLILPALLLSSPIPAMSVSGTAWAMSLAERIGFARASVLLGVVWAAWHLPLFFLRVPGNEEYGQSFPVWALGVTALSVAFAWLYLRTNGSLLLTMLMHAAVNNIPHFLPSPVADAKGTFLLRASPVAWLSVAFLWASAVYFLIRMPKAEMAATGTIGSDRHHGATAG